MPTTPQLFILGNFMSRDTLANAEFLWIGSDPLRRSAHTDYPTASKAVYFFSPSVARHFVVFLLELLISLFLAALRSRPAICAAVFKFFGRLIVTAGPEHVSFCLENCRILMGPAS